MLRKIKLCYYVHYSDETGRQRTLSLHTRDLTIAKRLHDDFMRQLAAAKMVLRLRKRREQWISVATPTAPPVIVPPRRGLLLRNMPDIAAKSRQLSPEHLFAWQRFREAVAPLKYASDITPKVALNYLDRHCNGGNGKRYNNVLTMLNVIFRSCLVAADMSASPFSAIPRRRVQAVQHFRPLTADEFVLAFNAAAEPWKSALLIGWHTALRRESVFRLSWQHIDADDRSITIMPGKTARFGRAVYIPIHPELWDHLQSLPRPKSPETPILSQWGQYIHYPGHKRQPYIAGLFDALGIADTSEGKAGFHSLRASFITRCDEAGILRRATRGVAGHAADQMTDLYSHDRQTAKQILALPGVLTAKK